MFRGTVGARGLFSATCAFLLLTACGTLEPGKNPTPAPTISAMPTAPPPLPDEARGTDEAAAIAYAKHYIDVLSYASVTGDTKYLRSLGDPSCVECKKYPDLYEKVYKDGGYYLRDSWKVVETELIRIPEGYEVIATIDAPPTRWRVSSNTQEQTKGSERYQVGFVVTANPGLKIIDMFSLESE